MPTMRRSPQPHLHPRRERTLPLEAESVQEARSNASFHPGEWVASRHAANPTHPMSAPSLQLFAGNQALSRLLADGNLEPKESGSPAPAVPEPGAGPRRLTGSSPVTAPRLPALSMAGTLRRLARASSAESFSQQRPPALQRDASSDGPSDDAPLGSIHLDPAIPAGIGKLSARLAALQAQLEPAQLLSQLASAYLGASPGPAVTKPPSPAFMPDPRTAPRKSDGPTTGMVPGEELRTGTSGDLSDAILQLPEVKRLVDGFGSLVTEKLARGWRDMPDDGKGWLGATAVIVLDTALVVLISSPEARGFVGEKLRGQVIAVPGVPGLSVQLDLVGPQRFVGLYFDVGRYLPARLGFGEGSPSPMTSPLEPNAASPRGAGR